jgi:membrane dipeptidase
MPVQNPPIIDLHQDLLLHVERRDLYPGGHWQTSFEMLKRNNAKIIVASAFPVPDDHNFFNPAINELIEKDFESYRTYCKANPEWSVVKNGADVSAVLADKNRFGLLLHVEGLNVFSDEWDMLERWYGLGWRSLGLVWNKTNPLGGGTEDPASGLSPRGREIIGWLSGKRMLVDFAHMNAPTFFDAAKIYKGPIIISHGNAAALCPGPRNYTDEQLRLVAQSGGVAGVFFGSTYLVGKGAPGTVHDAVRHFKHLRDVMGIDHVALGSDFGGITTGMLADLNSVDTLPLLWDTLRADGFSEEDIEKIAYKNARRVLEAVLA